MTDEIKVAIHLEVPLSIANRLDKMATEERAKNRRNRVRPGRGRGTGARTVATRLLIEAINGCKPHPVAQKEN